MHIGILTCEILRTEIKAVIENTGIDTVFLVQPETINPVIGVLNKEVTERFLGDLADTGVTIKEKTLERIIKEIRELKITDSLIIKVTELRLHDYPDKLLAAIDEELKKLSSVADLVVLGYGLCGNSAQEVERVIRGANVPVVIPRDEEGQILNNCIEIAIGKSKVQSLLREERGTFFMSPAGAAIIEEPQVILESAINITAGRMNRNAASDTPKIVKILTNHYKRVVKICYSEADEKDVAFAKTVANFARKFGLEIKQVQGSSKVMLNALRKDSGGSK